jgi:hypothetical protein
MLAVKLWRKSSDPAFGFRFRTIGGAIARKCATTERAEF